MNSRPEAPNFPSQVYNMSQDLHLFQAPKARPEPPKNLSYQVPSSPSLADRLEPLFPWEEKQTKATRVFPDDLPSPQPQGALPGAAPPSTMTDNKEDVKTSPTVPSVAVSSPQPFTSYNRTNAWDDDPKIERYIQNLPQNRRRKIQVFASSSTVVESPGLEKPSREGRRPSMKLTDFPTEIERPSLPVTPAPIRRPSFWGEERNAAGELPSAEGVPEQSDWDPANKLADLQRRQSEVLAQSPSSPSRAIPDRQLLGSTLPAATSEELTAPPSFRHLGFSGAISRGSRDDEALGNPIESTG